MENNIFKLLRQKLSSKPNNDFDKTFWSKFDAEFKPKKEFNWLWIPALATGALAITLVLTKQEIVVNQSDLLATTEMIESQEMLEDMDMFLEFDSLAIEDEDWNMLLDGEAS